MIITIRANNKIKKSFLFLYFFNINGTPFSLNMEAVLLKYVPSRISIKPCLFKIFLIITILTLSCFAKEIKTIDFSGDIDLVLGDFSKKNQKKVCDISYPTIYKFWKEKPIFSEKVLFLYPK